MTELKRKKPVSLRNNDEGMDGAERLRALAGEQYENAYEKRQQSLNELERLVNILDGHDPQPRGVWGWLKSRLKWK